MSETETLEFIETPTPESVRALAGRLRSAEEQAARVISIAHDARALASDVHHHPSRLLNDARLTLDRLESTRAEATDLLPAIRHALLDAQAQAKGSADPRFMLDVDDLMAGRDAGGVVIAVVGAQDITARDQRERDRARSLAFDLDAATDVLEDRLASSALVVPELREALAVIAEATLTSESGRRRERIARALDEARRHIVAAFHVQEEHRDLVRELQARTGRPLDSPAVLVPDETAWRALLPDTERAALEHEGDNK